MPLGDEETAEKDTRENKSRETERSLDLWKLKRITDNCLLRINDNAELLRPEGSYDFGFASKYRGSINSFDVGIMFLLQMLCDTTNHFPFSV